MSESDLTKDCLRQVSTILTRNSPRRVVASQSDTLHIYVDASFNEVDYCGIGGLIIDMHGDCLSFFSAKVEKEMIDAIVSRGQRAIMKCWLFCAPSSVGRKEPRFTGSCCSLTVSQCGEPFLKVGRPTLTVTDF